MIEMVVLATRRVNKSDGSLLYAKSDVCIRFPTFVRLHLHYSFGALIFIVTVIFYSDGVR